MDLKDPSQDLQDYIWVSDVEKNKVALMRVFVEREDPTSKVSLLSQLLCSSFLPFFLFLIVGLFGCLCWRNGELESPHSKDLWIPLFLIFQFSFTYFFTLSP